MNESAYIFHPETGRVLLRNLATGQERFRPADNAAAKVARGEWAYVLQGEDDADSDPGPPTDSEESAGGGTPPADSPEQVDYEYLSRAELDTLHSRFYGKAPGSHWSDDAVIRRLMSYEPAESPQSAAEADDDTQGPDSTDGPHTGA